MNSRSSVFLCVVAFLLAGCVPRSPIDAKKTRARAESDVGKNASAQQLTDRDILVMKPRRRYPKKTARRPARPQTVYFYRGAEQSGSVAV